MVDSDKKVWWFINVHLSWIVIKYFWLDLTWLTNIYIFHLWQNYFILYFSKKLCSTTIRIPPGRRIRMVLSYQQINVYFKDRPICKAAINIKSRPRIQDIYTPAIRYAIFIQSYSLMQSTLFPSRQLARRFPQVSFDYRWCQMSTQCSVQASIISLQSPGHVIPDKHSFHLYWFSFSLRIRRIFKS